MTLRIAVMGCLLAAAGHAQTGTDGQPITMHNDPLTFINGSIQFNLLKRTFVPQANVEALRKAGPIPGFPRLFFSEEGLTLLQHGHPATGVSQIILVLQPSSPTSGILEEVKAIQFHDGDKLHVSLHLSGEINPYGEIILMKGSIPGVAALIPAHASTPSEFDPCLAAISKPIREAAGASVTARSDMTATSVTWRSRVKTVTLGSRIVLAAAVTSASGTVPAAQATLWHNGVKVLTGAVQIGGGTRFQVTPDVSGDHCFAIAYPDTGNFAASKSAETCVRVLPAACPVMDDTQLQAYKVRAANVANTVWAIHSDKKWEPATADLDPLLTVVKYPEPKSSPTPLMQSIWLESNPPVKTLINQNCGAVHFCRMQDTPDQRGNWTLTPDCGPVKFTCHGKNYTWTPPNTGIFNQNNTSAH